MSVEKNPNPVIVSILTLIIIFMLLVCFAVSFSIIGGNERKGENLVVDKFINHSEIK